MLGNLQNLPDARRDAWRWEELWRRDCTSCGRVAESSKQFINALGGLRCVSGTTMAKWYQSTIGAFPTQRCNGGYEPAEVDDEVELSEDADREGLKVLTWFRFLGMPGPSLTAVCNRDKSQTQRPGTRITCADAAARCKTDWTSLE